MILKSHDQKITEFSNAGDSDKSTSRFLLRLGSREMWEERKQDKKIQTTLQEKFYHQGDKRNEAISGRGDGIKRKMEEITSCLNINGNVLLEENIDDTGKTRKSKVLEQARGNTECNPKQTWRFGLRQEIGLALASTVTEGKGQVGV